MKIEINEEIIYYMQKPIFQNKYCNRKRSSVQHESCPYIIEDTEECILFNKSVYLVGERFKRCQDCFLFIKEVINDEE